MKADGDTTALEKLLRPLPLVLTKELAKALVNLRADEQTQARYDELAEKQSDGCLTPPEQEELEAMVRANTFLGLLKAEAKSVLIRSKPA